MKNFNDLKFEPLLLPNGLNLVPRYLFEQVKDNDWNIENLYRYGAAFITSPLNRFWVLTDVAHAIKGILWLTIDPLRERMNVVFLSVDKEYQRPAGQAIKSCIDFLRKYRQELKNKGGIELNEKIITGSKRPKAFLRSGFKQSEYVTLEV